MAARVLVPRIAVIFAFVVVIAREEVEAATWRTWIVPRLVAIYTNIHGSVVLAIVLVACIPIAHPVYALT